MIVDKQGLIGQKKHLRLASHDMMLQKAKEYGTGEQLIKSSSPEKAAFQSNTLEATSSLMKDDLVSRARVKSGLTGADGDNTRSVMTIEPPHEVTERIICFKNRSRR